MLRIRKRKHCFNRKRKQHLPDSRRLAAVREAESAAMCYHEPPMSVFSCDAHV